MALRLSNRRCFLCDPKSVIYTAVGGIGVFVDRL